MKLDFTTVMRKRSIREVVGSEVDVIGADIDEGQWRLADEPVRERKENGGWWAGERTKQEGEEMGEEEDDSCGQAKSPEMAPVSSPPLAPPTAARCELCSFLLSFSRQAPIHLSSAGSRDGYCCFCLFSDDALCSAESFDVQGYGHGHGRRPGVSRSGTTCARVCFGSRVGGWLTKACRSCLAAPAACCAFDGAR